MTSDKRIERAAVQARAAVDASARIAAAVAAGKPPAFADAKVLEAVGCWLRRNGAK